MFNLKLPTMMGLAALLIFAATVMTACGGDDTDAQPGLTDEQVREMVRDEVSASATAQGGLTRAEVEEAIQAALSDLPDAGLNEADVGADAAGYKFGPQMLAVTGDGSWVSYVYNNQASDGLGDEERHLGAVELKHA